jgi:hypothetical protein
MDVISLISNFILPLLFTVSFVVFIWGLFLYVIAGGHDEHLREQGKVLLLYAFVTFVVVALITWLSSGMGYVV